jgi:hypothetical protein
MLREPQARSSIAPPSWTKAVSLFREHTRPRVSGSAPFLNPPSLPVLIQIRATPLQLTFPSFLLTLRNHGRKKPAAKPAPPQTLSAKEKTASRFLFFKLMLDHISGEN